MRRSWIKLYVDQTLRGSCFTEMHPDERFVWFGFLLLAGDNVIEGKISVTENMGYSNEQLSDLLKCDIDLIKRSIDKMIEFDKVKLNGSNVIEIVNWKKYQSEYQRQRDYREEYKKRKKLQRKVTPRSAVKSNKVDIDIERDINKDKEKKEKEKPSKKKRVMKKELTKEEKRNYAQGMSKERSWSSQKEKPEIIKTEFDYQDKELNKKAKSCYKEFGSSCSVRKEKGINSKCIMCLGNRGNY